MWPTRFASLVLLALSGCLDRPVTAFCPVVQSAVSEVVKFDAVQKLDLLLVVDNSDSMAGHQTNIMAQLGPLIAQLTDPPCISREIPGGGPLHACDRANPEDVRQYPPVADVHVGVISTDLGTGGFRVAGCDDAARGDDGMLNPIRHGFALQTHLPWAVRRPGAVDAPPGFRPAVCDDDMNQFPPFIRFCSDNADPGCDVAGTNAATRDAAQFSDWFKCNAGLFINGCGLEAPLEAAWRALVEHNARDSTGNPSPNAGFVRDDALLAIVVLSDEEDGSARDCDHDHGFSLQGGGACSDAKDVYDSSSGAWADATNLDLRFYRYTPGDARDPNWNLDRYVNTAPASAPNRWNRDLLSLKPGHPERVIFAAIVGVPLELHRIGDQINWTRLLGDPGPGGSSDFYGRDSSTALSGTQGAAGPFSMRAANMDPQCAHVVPACRREGSAYDPTQPCSNAQPMAFPSRRIVEIARRFDEAPLCNGQPCRNAMVASICANHFAPALRGIVQKLAVRLGGKCLPRLLEVRTNSEGNRVASCVLREIQPIEIQRCDAARGRRDPDAAEDRVFVDEQGESHTVCDIDQIATDPATLAPVSRDRGWYYDRSLDPTNPTCTQRISYTAGAAASFGSITRLECVQQSEDSCGASVASRTE